MKKLLTICLALIFIPSLNAQTQVNPFLQPESNAKAYLGLSTGINNMVGLLGAQVEIVANKHLVAGAGIGLSSWGTKWELNLQYYTQGWYKFYIKGGYSRNSGLDNFETQMELQNGSKEYVFMDLNPVGNVFFTAGHAWKVGKRNKFYIEGGYAVPLDTEGYYTLLDPVELSNTSEQVLQIMRPGGLVIALGINFAISY